MDFMTIMTRISLTTTCGFLNNYGTVIEAALVIICSIVPSSEQIMKLQAKEIEP